MSDSPELVQQKKDKSFQNLSYSPSGESMIGSSGPPPPFQLKAAFPVQMRADRSVQDKARNQHEKRRVNTVPGFRDDRYATFEDNDLTAPEINFDHGFLDDGNGNIDDSLREDPTWGDRLSKLKWIGMLEAAEAIRPDLVDSTRAYRHFLFGEGAPYEFSYERFVGNDNSGAIVLQSAIEDTFDHAIQRHDDQIAGMDADAIPATSNFQFRSNPISVGGDNRYPYPATENWQKAIGGHTIWLEADVTVTVDKDAGTRAFHIDFTLHMQDRYNFNPGQADIATGIADAENGRFEITGLGHEFDQSAELTRELDRTLPLAAGSGSGGSINADDDVSGAPRTTPRGPRRAVTGGTRRERF